MTNNIDVDRIHGFDAMRAIMMLLGLVLHASMTYSDINYGSVWPLKDPTNNHVFHIIIEFIHLFRMPAFFVIAGFFGALLFYKKSPGTMVSNRVHRIVYPFIVALFILWPLAVFTFNFSAQMISGNQDGLSIAINAVYPDGLTPENTIHLWFLYYLALISFLTCLIAWGLKQFNFIVTKIKNCFEVCHKKFIILIPLVLITFFTLYQMQSSFAITSSSFVPDLNTAMFYIVFYWYGWALYQSKKLISNFIQPAWIMLVFGTIIFIVKMYFDDSESGLSLYFAMFANSLATWLYIFACMGLFLRYASNGSYALRYISDAAYWIYLIHLPLVALIVGLISGIDLSALSKFGIVVFIATAICVATYHFLVRNTFIGLFLNGKKYPK